MEERVAVLLMDYGAPGTDAEVRPFIARLLSDSAILPLPWGLRHALANGIAWRRAGRVAGRYRAIGGSPLPAAVSTMAETIGDRLGKRFEVRPAYCYSAPRVAQVVSNLAGDGIGRVVGVPLFPQRSHVTTDSCQRRLLQAAQRSGLAAAMVPDFPTAPGLLDALREGVEPLLRPGAHVLMVAHGLPLRLERAGDPYPSRVRETAEALAGMLPTEQPWSLAFQSRLGPAAWTGPYLDEELERLAKAGVSDLVLVPLSFASENLETRWDLDEVASEQARTLGIARVVRSPTPGAHPAFLDLVHDLVREAVRSAGWSPMRGET